MLYHRSPSQDPQGIKRESYNFPLYATPAVHEAGVVRRDALYVESQGRGLDCRPAYSIYNSTASPGASTMPQKRPAPPIDSNGAPTKHIKAEHPEEFSNAVKKRVQSSTRTGQACDRCKVRWTPPASPKLSLGISLAALPQQLTQFIRFERSGVMAFPVDARPVCRTIRNAEPRIGSPVVPPPVAMSRVWSNRIVTCNTAYRSWNSD